MYILSGVFFYYAYKQAKEKELRDFVRRGLLFVYSNNPEELGQNISEITDIDTIKTVLKNGCLILDRDLGFVRIKLFQYKEDHYLMMNKFGLTYVLKKNDSVEIHKLLLLGYILFNAAFLLLYINIVRSFYPLKQVRDKIRLLKSGNLDVDMDIKKDDEIGFIAREFNEAVKSLKRNEELKKWFLRNIAHELKTPITKGKIAIELLNDEKGRENFEKIFNRLEYLVNQLLLVEKITSEKFKVNRECTNIKKIIEDALDLLLISEKNLVDINIEKDEEISVDKSIFPIALKNLIDNGLKFGEDGKCMLVYRENTLSIINKGDKPPIDINLLFEPFIKETSLKNRDGLGLGLYITKFILQIHGLKIDYEYRDGENIFTIDLKPILC